jgi:Protein of unknown function (DUF1566)
MQLRHFIVALLLPLAATAATAAPFEISADGREVTDAATGLVWRRCAEGLQWDGRACEGDAQTFSFDKARQHAQFESTNSKKNWRVPTLKELFTLVDKAQPAPTIDPKAFPNTPAIQFWTSTLNAKENHRAHFVFFATGLSNEDVRVMPLHLRLVRDK